MNVGLTTRRFDVVRHSWRTMASQHLSRIHRETVEYRQRARKAECLSFHLILISTKLLDFGSRGAHECRLDPVSDGDGGGVDGGDSWCSSRSVRVLHLS